MKRTLIALLFFCSAALLAENVKGGKCEASINGQKIKYVYITGNPNSVVWAYKHIAEETCLTPTIDASKADVILELRVPEHSGLQSAAEGDPSSITVNCTSSRNSVDCTDSSGNIMQTICTGNDCSSYYGPNPVGSILHSFHEWMDRRWWASNAFLYTPDMKPLWDSLHQKSRWIDSQWPGKLRIGTHSPKCEVSTWNSRHGTETYRKLAVKKCGVEFDPLVSIDIKLQLSQSSDEKASR